MAVDYDADYASMYVARGNGVFEVWKGQFRDKDCALIFKLIKEILLHHSPLL